MKVIGANLKENGKTYYFISNISNLKRGDKIIVETEKFSQFASVEIADVKDFDKNLKLKRVIRIATKKDIEQNDKNKKEAKLALDKCNDLIKKFKLNMKLLSSDYTFDRKQLMFQFTSDNRVDFRELAKELASIYKTRIELRQIGVRDKAKCVGGIGICGRELCCKKFLHDMDSVSINMAKNQNLALNPSKINGSCGRLLCCLKYEDGNYCESKKGMPHIGDNIQTDFGEGKVTSVMICERKYTVDVPGHGTVSITVEN